MYLRQATAQLVLMIDISVLIYPGQRPTGTKLLHGADQLEALKVRIHCFKL